MDYTIKIKIYNSVYCESMESEYMSIKEDWVNTRNVMIIDNGLWYGDTNNDIITFYIKELDKWFSETDFNQFYHQHVKMKIIRKADDEYVVTYIVS